VMSTTAALLDHPDYSSARPDTPVVERKKYMDIEKQRDMDRHGHTDRQTGRRTGRGSEAEIR
jgi:hypothetical protein